ncbi:MAG: type II secretion system protein [Chloroflexi bacterium]|nr:type II secretion system protein [Chloroflexota bacterium]
MDKVTVVPEEMRSQKGFTLVELLVVVGIVVALAAVSIVSVSQFSGKGDEAAQASEVAMVQSAMDTMMADKSLTGVTAPATSTNSFSTVPTEGALTGYMRDETTVYYYCWSGNGKVTQVASGATC